MRNFLKMLTELSFQDIIPVNHFRRGCKGKNPARNVEEGSAASFNYQAGLFTLNNSDKETKDIPALVLA